MYFLDIIRTEMVSGWKYRQIRAQRNEPEVWMGGGVNGVCGSETSKKKEQRQKPHTQTRRDGAPELVLGFIVRATRPKFVLGFIVRATRPHGLPNPKES